MPTFVMRIPWSFLESTLWTMLVRAWLAQLRRSCSSHDYEGAFLSNFACFQLMQVYWLVGFSPSVRFLMFW